MTFTQKTRMLSWYRDLILNDFSYVSILASENQGQKKLRSPEEHLSLIAKLFRGVCDYTQTTHTQSARPPPVAVKPIGVYMLWIYPQVWEFQVKTLTYGHVAFELIGSRTTVFSHSWVKWKFWSEWRDQPWKSGLGSLESERLDWSIGVQAPPPWFPGPAPVTSQ